MSVSFSGDILTNVSVTDLSYLDTFWDDLKAPLTAVKLAGVKDPTFEKFADVDGAGGSTGCYAYSFAAGVEREVFLAKQTNHSKKNGTNLHLHCHWGPSDANAGTVRFGVEVTAVGIGGTFGNTTISYFTDTCDGTAKTHEIAGEVDVSIPSETVSSMVLIRFFRDGGDAADTYGSKIWVYEVDAHFEIDQPGSRTEYAK